MADLKKLAERAIELIKKNSCDGFVRVSSNKKSEFNIEGGEFTLYRTLFDENVGVGVYKDTKKGYYQTNKLTEEDIDKAVDAAITSAESSQPDDGNVLAPCAGTFNDVQGVYECDQDKLFFRVKELKETLEKDFPLIQIVAIIAQHNAADYIYATTAGTFSTERFGSYSVTLEIAGHEGDKTSSMVYSGAGTLSLDKPFLDLADFRFRVDTAIKQLHAEPIEGKFTGTMVLTPGILGMALYSISGMAGGGSILDKSSIYLDKLGKKIADERINVTFSVDDERIIHHPVLTGDGYKAETQDFIKDGVLNRFSINDYISRKTGFERAKNDSDGMIVRPGDKSLDEIIQGIEKGILVGDFSGGQPAPNGEFSGIAKASFLIENGKVTKALSETMINGNFADMVNNLRGISKETIEDGWSSLPYMAFDGIVISGK
jgi:PmbA protein